MARGTAARGQNPGSAHDVRVVVDDLTGPQIARFLEEHVREMLATTPPESKHALDLDALRGPDITFWSVMDGGDVVGCAALKFGFTYCEPFADYRPDPLSVFLTRGLPEPPG
jgi:hypothetical protein